MLTTLTSPETLFPINFSAGTDWAEAEFGSIDLGDVRSSRRLVASFASMLASPGKSIYELLVEAQTHRDEGMALLVRSQYNRSLVDETEAFLWERLSASPSQGSVKLKLSRSQWTQRGRPPRSRSALAGPSQTRSHHRGLAAIPPYQYLWIKIRTCPRFSMRSLLSRISGALRSTSKPTFGPSSRRGTAQQASPRESGDKSHAVHGLRRPLLSFHPMGSGVALRRHPSPLISIAPSKLSCLLIA